MIDRFSKFHSSRMEGFLEGSLLVGFLGDLFLQWFFPSRYGLEGYFKKHGPLMSMFIASGMMGVFSLLYVFLGLKLTILGVFIYGAILDLIFRFSPFLNPLLGEYYSTNGMGWTMLWGGIPFVLSLILGRFIQ